MIIKKKSGREYTRELVRIRDNYTCRVCGKRRTPQKAKSLKKRLFDIHHLNNLCGKLSRKYDRVGDMDGLITLCHKCHFSRHDWHGGQPLKNGYKPHSQLIKRNKEIFSKYVFGSEVALAKEYKISPQRVSQILVALRKERLSTSVMVRGRTVCYK